MKVFASTLLFVFFLVGCQSLKTQHPEKANVRIFVKYIAPGCGGMPPSEEADRIRLQGKPFANQEVAFFENNEFKSYVTTDENGYVFFQLENGSYSLKNKWKANLSKVKKEADKHGWKIDELCFKNWLNLRNVDFEVTTDSEITDTLTIFGRCSYEGTFPCIKNLDEIPR